MCFKCGQQTYALKIEDLLALPDYAGKKKKYTKPAILIGNRNKGINDCLLSSRKELQKLAETQEYVETEVYFKPAIGSWNVLLLLIGCWRKKFKVTGTNSYHIRTEEIKDKGLIRCVRNRDTAYQFTQCYIPDEERHKLYDDLEREIIQNGWDDKNGQLVIMLCRSLSYIDSLDDGNHRINICLENKIPEVTVRFRYVGKLPSFLIQLFEVLSKFRFHH